MQDKNLLMWRRWLLPVQCLLFRAVFLSGVVMTSGAMAHEIGACVVYREGGVGKVLKTPTYWVRGQVHEIRTEQRLAARCPGLAKPLWSFTHQDWLERAAAFPCVDDEADIREVTVSRVRFLVDAWETPWSRAQGVAGLLFRGQFMGVDLSRGAIVELDASWLESCSQ